MFPQSYLLGRSYEGAKPVEAVPLPLYVSEDLPVQFMQGKNGWVVALGHAAVPDEGISELKGTAEWIASHLTDLDTLWSKISILAGRYVLVASIKDKIYVMPDATASRVVCYGGGLVSSHAALLATAISDPPTPDVLSLIESKYYKTGIRHLPGMLSSFEKVRMLSANTVLDHSRGVALPMNVDRPAESLTPGDIAKVIQKNYTTWRNSSEIVLSLTGGIDSRISFAAAIADGRPFSCYTYVHNKESEIDNDAAAKLCSEFGIHHLSIPVYSSPPEFRERHKFVTSGVRNTREADVIYSCSKSIPQGQIEIKSSLSEIGRAFYRRRMYIAPTKLGPRAMTALYKNWLPRKHRDFARSAFAHFPDPSRHNNLDPLDVFYWEYRLTAWQGLQLQDFDLSHPTIPLFNSRKLLLSLLTLPLETRLQDQAQRQIISTLYRDVQSPQFTPIPIWKKMLRTTLFAAMVAL